MRIAICDDDKQAVDLLLAIVEKWRVRQHRPITVEHHYSADSFLFSWEKQLYDVALLDIRMKGMSGIDLAREIRKTDKHMTIILVTSYQALALQGFSVGVKTYLQKPVQETECFRELDNALEAFKMREVDVFAYQSVNQSIIVSKADILYFQSKGHYANLVMKDKSYEFRMSMSKLEEVLPYPNFFRCHKSYIVNMHHVECIKRDRVLMSNNDIVWLGKFKWDEINACYVAARMNPSDPGSIFCTSNDDQRR